MSWNLVGVLSVVGVLDPIGVLDPSGVLGLVVLLDPADVLAPAGVLPDTSWRRLLPCVGSVGEATLFGGKLCWEICVPTSPLAQAQGVFGLLLCRLVSTLWCKTTPQKMNCQDQRSCHTISVTVSQLILSMTLHQTCHRVFPVCIGDLISVSI